MMVRDFVSSVEVQGEYRFVYYDYEEEIRKDISFEDCIDLQIRYVYCEYNVLFIEVDFSD